MSLQSFKDWLLPGIKRLWAPPFCEMCSTLVSRPPDLCDSCHHKLRPLSLSHCAICASPFSGSGLSTHLCSECLLERPGFEKVYSAFEFQGAAGDLLKRGKFGKQERVFNLLSRLALEAFRETLLEFRPELLCPMPLSWRRGIQRGFNQSFLLAKELKKLSGATLSLDLSVRRGHTEPQAKRDREARLHALKGVFALSRHRFLKKERVLIIDDVLTTGATAQALSETLRRGGASAVGVFTIARVRRK